MLDFDYPQHYAEVVQATFWSIEMPDEWSGYFQETGIMPFDHTDKRQAQRRIVRTRALLYFETALPCIPRDDQPLGVYTRDFSKDACGLVSPVELYPEEVVRLILPTFWLQLGVVRVRRHTASCYEVGLKLLRRHDPSRDAFIINERFARV